ncbi:uncharacterized protein LOC133834455 isoform X1 [Humulus lupulus]|uniref:uncharacterized protein LOC133834455 isoform X1 n=1 Tax=Humulus lupulus TaxID=3486 RepID=UPI002B400A8C|nr:uncharacterized protein LOC133834455 isoform X1 [Humulus lupulus]
MEIQNFIHSHPLLLIKDDITTINQLIKCGICEHPITAAPLYGCDSCQYFLHKSCAELPRQIYHSFHLAHPLFLIPINLTQYCDSCERVIPDSLFFECFDCNVLLDVDCASMAPITFTKSYGNNSIQHSSHQHPMLALDKVDNINRIHCFGCQSIIGSEDRAYGCTKCKYFLHESCAGSPKEIQYPFHWDHGLLSLHIQFFWFECTLCKQTLKTCFTYKCGRCTFRLCLKCSATKMRASIKFENHEHLLCYRDNMIPMDNHCTINDCYGKQSFISHCKEFSYTSSYATFCLECNFRLHLLCGPLPSVIEHESHIHPLVLVGSIVEDGYEEFYCDICETERDPRIRVYYCEPCKFIGHIHCLKSKIIQIITGNFRNVELKSIGDDIWKLKQGREVDHSSAIMNEEQEEAPLTLKDIINGLQVKYLSTLKIFYKWKDESFELKEQLENKLGEEDINWILQLSHLTIEDFQEFSSVLQNFYITTQLELKASNLGVKIVSVKNCKIPFTLAPVLNKLLDEYGDVSGDEDDWRWKCIVYTVLCQVIKEMCSITVGDITKDHLQEWYYHLRFVDDYDFQINFAFSHLEKLIHAFFGLQAKRLEAEIPKKLKEKELELEQEIKQVKSKLKKCEEYNDKSFPKSELLKDCLNEASALKFKKACEDLMITDNDSELQYLEW